MKITGITPDPRNRDSYYVNYMLSLYQFYHDFALETLGEMDKIAVVDI